MATRLVHEMVYEASLIEVAGMLSDPEFRQEVCRNQRATSYTVEIEGDANEKAVRIEMAQPTDRVPSFAKKLAGEEIPIIQEEHWSGDRADVLITIPGKPGDMKGTIQLEQRGDDVAQLIDLTVKVSIPLVGGKIEDLIAGLLQKAMRAENKVGTKWLAGEWTS